MRRRVGRHGILAAVADPALAPARQAHVRARLGWLLACVGFVALFQLGASLVGSSRLARHAWADGGWILVDGLATWACWQAARGARLPHLRRAWWCFTAALACWTTGMLAWAYLELVRGELVPFPSLNDLMAWLGVPWFVAGLFIYKARTSSRTLTAKQLADLAIIAAVVVTVAVAVLYAPARAAPYAASYVASALATPVLSVTTLLFGLSSLTQHVHGARRRVLALLLAGIGILAAVSILYAEALLAGRYQPGAWLDAMWVIALLLIATAAREEGWLPADERVADTPERPSGLDPLLPSAALLAWIVVVVLARGGHDAVLRWIDAITGCTLAAALFVRSWASQRLERTLTARVALQEARAWELEARLTRVQKLEAVGTLAGGVAHDFNNVLAAATSGLKLARRKLARGAAIDADLDEIEGVLWRATDLTGRLLDLARKRETRATPIDARQIIDRVRALLTKVLPAGITLELVEPDRWLPPVLADPNGLEHALLNLGLNARDVLRERGGTITFRAFRSKQLAASAADAVTIEVGDNGPGMPPELARRVFEPFFTTKPDGEGTGLGLAMVEAFAVECHGTVTVESTPGQGTAFRITLPAVDDDATDELPLPTLTGTVLVLCPQDAGGLATTGALERCGFTTLVVADAAAAMVAAAGPTPIEAMVADAASGIGAGGAVRALRAAGLTAPIVLLAGPGGDDSGDWAAVVRKPVDARELADLVRLAIATPRATPP